MTASRWCSQCKRDRPASDFLDLGRRRWKVTKCNACARRNMRKWALTDISKFDPDKVGQVDE
jgi:hypothetical protein